MGKLLKIEFLKVKSYRTFWILCGLYMLFMAVVIIGLDSFHFGMHGTDRKGVQLDFSALNVFAFPSIWQNVTYVAGYFKFFLAVMVVILVANEFEFRTIRQNIIDGLSRKEFFAGKMLMVFLTGLGAMLYVLILILFLGLKHTDEFSFDKLITHAEFLPGFFLEMTGYLCFVFMITLWVRKAAFAIGIYLFYSIVIEPILAFRFNAIAHYLPLQPFGNLIHQPFTRIIDPSIPQVISATDVGLSIFYLILFSAVSLQLILKRDL